MRNTRKNKFLTIKNDQNNTCCTEQNPCPNVPFGTGGELQIIVT
jgi:hypothetical protein